MRDVGEDPHLEDQWTRLLASHPAGRAIVPGWEEIAGWRNRRIAHVSKEGLIGGVVVALRRIPGLPFHLSRVSCLMTDEARAPGMTRSIFEAIERLAKDHWIVETEMRLRIPDANDLDEPGSSSHALVQSLEAFDYRPLRKIDATYLVQIDKNDEDLLASFEGRTRNAIRKAQRCGALVSTTQRLEILEELYTGSELTGARKGARMPPRAFVVDAIRPLLERGHAVLFAECYGERIANLAVIDMLGVPCYVLGARSRDHQEGKVQGGAQFLHFEIMRRLRDLGKKYYDLGGCEGPIPDPSHHNYGVWRFKYRFQGRFVRFLPYYRRVRPSLTRPLMAAVHRLRGDDV